MPCVSYVDFLSAIKDGCIETVQEYVSQSTKSEIDIPINSKLIWCGTQGYEPLIWAASRGYTEIVQSLLTVNGINANVVDSGGNSALMVAASNGYTEIVKNLIAASDDIAVNTTNYGNGSTALICAAELGYNEIVQNLCAVPSTQVNLGDKDKSTALMYAAKKGYTPVVQSLLAFEGIDVNAINHKGCTALIWAAQYGYAPVVQSLLAFKGININAFDNFKSTALIWAAIGGYTEIVQSLLAVKGIDVNVVDKGGHTALILAASAGYVTIVKALLNSPYLSVDYMNQGKKALDAARRNSHSLVQEALCAFYRYPIPVVNKPNHQSERFSAQSSLINEDQEQGMTTTASDLGSSSQVLPSKKTFNFQERLSAIHFDEREISEEFIDPISHTIINDPIVVSTGITYDRKSLQDYFSSKGDPSSLPCPMTTLPIYKEELKNKGVITIKNLIENCVKKQEDNFRTLLQQETKAVSSLSSRAKPAQTSQEEPEGLSLENPRRARPRFFGEPKSQPAQSIASASHKSTCNIC